MIHRRSIVYNIQWCGIIYVCTYTRVTHTEKRKSKIFRGLRPLDPRQGLCPCTPPGALRRAPGPHPKSARAYAFAMCAPRTCLPPKKKSARAYALAMCAPRTCLPPKKSDPSNSKKSARASRSLCALRAHVCPPIINRCPLLAPPLFKSWCRHCLSRLSTLLVQAKTRFYQILSRLEFGPFHKSTFCSLKHEILSNYVVSSERRDPQQSIGMDISWKYFAKFNWGDFKKV